MTGLDQRHRLEGLEPDNLLAFLALLGLLRALEAARPGWHPRAAWDIEAAPMRPFLHMRESVGRGDLLSSVEEGIHTLAKAYDFGGLTKLKLSQGDARTRLMESQQRAQESIDTDA